jgi:hypothetical protein
MDGRLRLSRERDCEPEGGARTLKGTNASPICTQPTPYSGFEKGQLREVRRCALLHLSPKYNSRTIAGAALALRTTEHAPGLRDMFLRWTFAVIVKGEHRVDC